jgi:hypothetical protein
MPLLLARMVRRGGRWACPLASYWKTASMFPVSAARGACQLYAFGKCDQEDSGQRDLAMIFTNCIMIHINGPKSDGTYLA